MISSTNFQNKSSTFIWIFCMYQGWPSYCVQEEEEMGLKFNTSFFWVSHRNDLLMCVQPWEEGMMMITAALLPSSVSRCCFVSSNSMSGFCGFSFSFFSPHGPLAAGMYIIASTFSVILMINPCRERVRGFKVTWTSFRPEVFWLSRVDSECVSATQIAASVLLEFPSNFVSGWNFAWLSFARKVKILGDGYFQVAARWMNSDLHSLAEHFEDLGTCQIVQNCFKILLSLLVCNRY